MAESEIERLAMNATKFETYALLSTAPFVLGIAFTPLQRALERFSEHLFFNRKNEAELILAALRTDVAENDAPDAVIARTLTRPQTVFRFAAVAVYIHDDGELRQLALRGSARVLPEFLAAPHLDRAQHHTIILRGRHIGTLAWFETPENQLTKDETRILRDIAHELGVEMTFRTAVPA